jgi:hypothetical protein
MRLAPRHGWRREEQHQRVDPSPEATTAAEGLINEAGRHGEATPASAHGRHGARAQVQAAPGDTSPPREAPGDLFGSGRATRRQIDDGGSRVRAPSGTEAWAARVWSFGARSGGDDL